MIEGFVAALPSGKSRVGTVWLPPLTDMTYSAVPGSSLDVDLGEADALALHLGLQAAAVAAPRRREHRDGARGGQGPVGRLGGHAVRLLRVDGSAL